MASRLSELSVKSQYDSGFASLPWEAPEAGANLLKVDLDRVIASSDSKALIQSLPAQLLYHSLKGADLPQQAEVLSLLTNDQFTRILDYDVWRQDVLATKDALQWLLPLKSLGP